MLQYHHRSVLSVSGSVSVNKIVIISFVGGIKTKALKPHQFPGIKSVSVIVLQKIVSLNTFYFHV